MDEREKKSLIELLNKVDPKKPYGTELFDALARPTISVAIEAVCLRWNAAAREVQVYLIQRSANDTAYPREWHCPGSVLRPGEEIDNVFDRLGQKEFGTKFLKTQFASNVNHPTEARGHFFSVVYLCAFEEKEELKGSWFPINQLPEKTVKSHRKRIIPAAFGAFVAADTSIYT